MIVLPTRRRLERRRDTLYKHLHAILHCASVNQVEEIMRNIHGINLKIKTYFIRDIYHEPEEFFENDDYFEVKDPFETQDPTESQIRQAAEGIDI